MKKKHRHAIRFQDKEWMLKVCYLNDIFTAVNDLNTSMQGRNQNIITLSEKLSPFKELQLWKMKLERGRTAAFPSMNKYLEEWNQIAISRIDVIKPILMEHLENLIMEFNRYIPDRNLASQVWVRNPFLAKVDNLLKDVAGLQEELIDLHHDEFHRQLSSTVSLGELWTSVKKEKPIIGNEAMTSAPVCDHVSVRARIFGTYLIKTKVGNRLDPGDDMRMALSKIEPCVEDIMKEKFQFHQSHLSVIHHCFIAQCTTTGCLCLVYSIGI